MAGSPQRDADELRAVHVTEGRGAEPRAAQAAPFVSAARSTAWPSRALSVHDNPIIRMSEAIGAQG